MQNNTKQGYAQYFTLTSEGVSSFAHLTRISIMQSHALALSQFGK